MGPLRLHHAGRSVSLLGACDFVDFAVPWLIFYYDIICFPPQNRELILITNLRAYMMYDDLTECSVDRRGLVIFSYGQQRL